MLLMQWLMWFSDSLFLQSEEGDFLAKLSKLVNGMGVQLIQCWQKWVFNLIFLASKQPAIMLNISKPQRLLLNFHEVYFCSIFQPAFFI
jgi:hypothetical protein